MTDVVQGLDPAVKARILVDALPYIRRFWGQVVVVKYGGNALAGTATSHEAIRMALRGIGANPLLVEAFGPRPPTLTRH